MTAMLLIKTNTNAVPDTAGRWERGEIVAVVEHDAVLGSGELDIASFYRFTITDQTVAAVQGFLDAYNRDIEFTLINAGPPRRYEANNKNANSEGIGHWTTEVTDNIKTAWEVDHPAADIQTIGFPNTGVNGLGNVWDMSGVFSVGEGAEFQAIVVEEGLGVLDKRRIWYITEAGMVNIANAGGSQSGTSAQLSPIMRDGLLD
jgi:hypothetical protein